MAIAKSGADEKVTFENKLYTGLCNMSVVAINPATPEQIEELGYRKPTQAPNYHSTEAGADKLRLDIYLQNSAHNIKAKLAFWLENQDRVSQTGKFEWINDFAQSCFADSPNAYDWFKGQTARKALVGEVSLHDFIKVWANVATKEDENGRIPNCKLDRIQDYFRGDYSELTNLVTELTEYKVKVLLGVREVSTEDENGIPKTSYYQDVYTKMFARSYQDSYTMWHKKLADEYGAYKHDYQDCLELKEYNPSSSPTPNSTSSSEEEQPF